MGLEFIRAIQQYSSPALNMVMEAVTLFGETMVVAAAFCVVYWCVDKRLGQYLAVALGASICINGVVKDVFKVERMFDDPGVSGIISHRIKTATGYSFPSGHTQAAATLWGGMMLTSKRAAPRVLFAVLILMVGFSRLYLGVHYPADVAGGLVIGLICAASFCYMMMARQNYRLAVAICFAAGATALCLGESDDTFKAAGTLAGILLGLYFEERFVRFKVAGIPVSKKLRRLALGMAIVFVVHTVPGLLLPRYLPLDSFRYAFTVFTASGLVPFVFKKLGL